MKTDDKTLIEALEILARDIESGDGVANACIAEAAQRLLELTEWRPIETAPRDGTAIIIANKYDVQRARFKHGVWVIFRCSDPFYDEEWDEFSATHWMPLPQPPKADEK